MEILRTPEDRFAHLADYEFEPHYVSVPAGDGSHQVLRVHYLDEGPRDSDELLLLMHGELSWSYLYRKMIPPLVDSGFRVVAPDLVGQGRSDKPASRSHYTYARHVEWMRAALLDALELERITLVCHDWGGLMGLRLVAEHSERFRRVVAANTALPTGDKEISDAFLAWQNQSQELALPVGEIVSRGCVNPLPDEVITAYEAPFPEERYKEGMKQLPLLIPVWPDDPAAGANRLAWETLAELDIPFLCAFSDSDPITRNIDKAFMRSIRGAENQPHTTIKGAGHFLQEDNWQDLVAAVIRFVSTT
jgi:haloalkane dehalogenase